LTSDRVLANYDPTKPTRVYVDDGPARVAATVAHTVKDVDHPVWKRITHTSRAKTKAEINYGKVDGESLAVLSGIHSNKMYLDVPIRSKTTRQGNTNTEEAMTRQKECYSNNHHARR